MKIEDAVVLVTGSNRGLGRALVGALLEAGAARVYAGARDPRKLEAIVARAPEKIVPLALDVTDGRSLQAAAERASDVTVLVNNAGVFVSTGVLSSTPAQIEEDFAINFFGMLATTRAFLPALQRARGGGVINLLSVASLASMPALGGYAAAKAAAFSATQALRSELRRSGLDVHAVFPGPIDTDMIRHFDITKSSPEHVARAILEGVAQGLEDIFPDPVSQQMSTLWKSDPKALERQFAGA